MSLYRSGGGSFRPGMRCRPIIISGNTTASMAKDFIAEIFHTDHADDSEDLHLIFFFPSGGPEMDEVIRFTRLKQNISLAPKISVFRGSVLESEHLKRVSASKVEAFFVLPNLNCANPFQEDAENIIRMMAVRRYMPWARVILLLLKAESRGILADAGINGDSGDSKLTILAADQFKLELVGKSIDVLGFAPLICNLCKSVGEDEDEGEDAEKPVWLKEYELGVGNELYEIELSPLYSDKRQAVFSEVVIDVLEQNGGTVYLIGLVEQSTRENTKQILVNPGPQYPIKLTTTGIRTFGIFIADHRDSVQQCELNMVFLGHRERHNGNAGPRAAAAEEAWRSVPTTPLKSPTELALSTIAGPDLRRRAEKLVALAQVHHHGQQPRRAPLHLLAKGGHVLLMCVGAQNEKDFRLGVQHFVRPLRQAKALKEMVPIVVMSPVLPRDWETVCDQHAVYFFKGSPLYQMDLERANFRAAAAIFICNVASGTEERRAEDWVTDSGTVCCARLVEAQLGWGTRTLVIADLKCNTNHIFLPVPLTSNTGSGLEGINDDSAPDSVYQANPNDEKRLRIRQSFDNLGSLPLGNAAAIEQAAFVKMSKRQSVVKRRSSLNSVVTAASDRVKDGIEQQEKFKQFNKEPEPFYLQPRFASGQMFCGSVVTSLVVNTFYNPSLSELVSSMISALVFILQVPNEWIGKSYFDFFDHLLVEENRLCVGILRRADPSQLGESGKLIVEEAQGDAPKQKRRYAFIYTAPPAKETTMTDTDRVLCFGVSERVQGSLTGTT